MKARRRERGFTLIEVLVALLMMALLTALAWQALDGVLRARDDGRASIDRTSRLATVLAQWQQDLQSVVDTETVPPLAFDGQTLRLTRRADTGVTVVAWSVRGGRWQRWAAPPLARSGELQETWVRSLQLQGSEPGHLTLSDKASTWQIYFARGGQWSNAQSTGDLAAAPVASQAPPPAGPSSSAAAAPPAEGSSAPPATPPGGSGGVSPGGQSGVSPGGSQTLREALPEAVRMVITLDGKTLTRDIALGPSGS